MHLYDNSELKWRLEDGTGIQLTQKTDYPWQGVVDFSLIPAAPVQFALYLRIPGWADSAEVSVNGKKINGATPGQYLPIRRQWSPGDAIRLQLDMRPQMLQANSRIVEDNGRVAVQRGPLVYCMEQLDQPAGTALPDVALEAGKQANSGFTGEYKADLLDGVMVLHHDGVVMQNSTSEPLYSRYEPRGQKTRSVPLTMIPYYAWANRQPSAMQVWTPVLRS